MLASSALRNFRLICTHALPLTFAVRRIGQPFQLLRTERLDVGIVAMLGQDSSIQGGSPFAC